MIFVIPGIYDRPGILFESPLKILPWTGLGAFRVGAEFLIKQDPHSISGEYIMSLPSGERAAIKAKSFEASLCYDFKMGFADKYNYSLGLLANYKDFTWKRPEVANRKDFALYTKIGIGWQPDGSREYSISAGISIFSYVKDSVVKKAPGSFFVSLYAGFY